MNDPEEFPVIPPTEMPAEPAPETLSPPSVVNLDTGDVPPPQRDLAVGSIPALIILSCSLIVCFVALPEIIAHFNLKWMFDHGTAQYLGPDLKTPPVPKSPLALGIGLSMLGSLVIGGILAIICVVMGCTDRNMRARLEKMLGWLAVRPLPALHFIDVAAVIVLSMTLHPIYVILLHGIVEIKGRGMITAYRMIGNDMAFVSAIIVGACIACWRARGAHGMRGIWPPWSNTYVSPKRAIWRDIALGVACYPLTLWMSTVAFGMNWFFASARNPHPIEIELAKNPSTLGATIFILAGTFGAAIMEETIFRGMLYNSLRRWLGGPVAAIGAAFIFALVHGQRSALFGLFTLGLIMTWLYDKTGRLVAGMAFHFTNNLVAMLYMMAVYNQ